jgi:hypothetical protein
MAVVVVVVVIVVSMVWGAGMVSRVMSRMGVGAVVVCRMVVVVSGTGMRSLSLAASAMGMSGLTFGLAMAVLFIMIGSMAAFSGLVMMFQVSFFRAMALMMGMVGPAV